MFTDSEREREKVEEPQSVGLFRTIWSGLQDRQCARKTLLFIIWSNSFKAKEGKGHISSVAMMNGHRGVIDLLRYLTLVLANFAADHYSCGCVITDSNKLSPSGLWVFSTQGMIRLVEKEYLIICANSVVFLRNLDLNCSLDSVLVHSRDSLADQGGEPRQCDEQASWPE